MALIWEAILKLMPNYENYSLSATLGWIRVPNDSGDQIFGSTVFCHEFDFWGNPSTDINWGPTQNTIYYHSQFKVRRLNGEDETHVGRGRSHKTIKISDETITTKEKRALEYTHPNPGNQSTHTQCTYHKNI